MIASSQSRAQRRFLRFFFLCLFLRASLRLPESLAGHLLLAHHLPTEPRQSLLGPEPPPPPTVSNAKIDCVPPSNSPSHLAMSDCVPSPLHLPSRSWVTRPLCLASDCFQGRGRLHPSDDLAVTPPPSTILSIISSQEPRLTSSSSHSCERLNRS
ncbi:hypothetical protein BT93_L2557 [Corymbia citriodora subsp. variegata]|uniref:Secreted protein n=1 Tax=Corymbia citriodora subsp. variegata TaxID=360336 RepID=A0A8T0CNP7_CORYI|nr:hypothetical protein BT93_L2557 [Corymbia citriodora subsp. variegata]